MLYMDNQWSTGPRFVTEWISQNRCFDSWNPLGVLITNVANATWFADGVAMNPETSWDPDFSGIWSNLSLEILEIGQKKSSGFIKRHAPCECRASAASPFFGTDGAGWTRTSQLGNVYCINTAWWFQTWILWLSIQLGTIIPFDELIFFRGVGIPPTRRSLICSLF